VVVECLAFIRYAERYPIRLIRPFLAEVIAIGSPDEAEGRFVVLAKKVIVDKYPTYLQKLVSQNDVVSHSWMDSYPVSGWRAHPRYCDPYEIFSYGWAYRVWALLPISGQVGRSLKAIGNPQHPISLDVKRFSGTLICNKDADYDREQVGKASLRR